VQPTELASSALMRLCIVPLSPSGPSFFDIKNEAFEHFMMPQVFKNMKIKLKRQRLE
jgi:hypothetical protein